MQAHRTRPADERGAALIVMVLSVMIAAAVALALTTVTAGRMKSTDNRLKMEAALAIADAGLQRGLAEANIPANRSSTSWPPAVTPAPTTSPTDYTDPKRDDGVTNITYSTAPFRLDGAVSTSGRVYEGEYTGSSGASAFNWRETGQFVVVFIRGDQDGVDNDNDGLVDALDLNAQGEPDERQFTMLESTGYLGKVTKDAAGRLSTANPHRAKVQGQIRKVTSQFDVKAAVFLQDPTPSVALGNSTTWLVSGKDYDMNNPNTVVAGSTPLPGIATNGNFGLVEELELNGGSVDPPGPNQPVLQGTTPPWQENVPKQYDMAATLAWANENVAASNKVIATSGQVDPGGPFGTPPTSPGGPDWQLTYHDVGGPPNVVKFAGGAPHGAGVWIINGDAEFGGNFNFTGIIVVTGRIYYRGGGNRTFLGAIIGGESGTLESMDVNGNASVKYSSAAVSNAANALASYSLGNWRKVGTQQ